MGRQGKARGGIGLAERACPVEVLDEGGRHGGRRNGCVDGQRIGLADGFDLGGQMLLQKGAQVPNAGELDGDACGHGVTAAFGNNAGFRGGPDRTADIDPRH